MTGATKNHPLVLACDACGARYVAPERLGPLERRALVENFRRIHAHKDRPFRFERAPDEIMEVSQG